MRFTTTPKDILLSDVLHNGFSFSSAQYNRVIIPNQNFIFVRDFLSRNLKRSDLGVEIGSKNYIDKSNKYFLRTKGLQDYSFLLDINNESITPMNPKAFINQSLSNGDLILSKDGNIGEAIILDKDYPDWMLSGALYKLPVHKWKYYLLAFLKHDCFREQLDYMVPKSATLRHAKKMFLECKVPLPNENSTLVINYVEELVKASIFLEIEIKEKYTKILNLIKTEISGNQKLTTYNYEFPSYKEMYDAGRFDTNLFTQYFKTQEFLISNYSHGCSSIEKLDFEISRGQNLQISAIGKSIYSDMIEKNFYTLMLPNHLSKFGTINKVEYLGNRRKLKILNKGDIIFGAEGFEKGRSIVIVDDKIKTITNIHGITLHHRQGNLVLSIFIKCFLDYLRAIGLIDLYAVGGNGGSLAMKYWNVISFPNFPRVKQEEISNLYYNQNANPQKIISSKENFINNIQTYINSAGIFEMDKTLKIIKKRISEVFDQIVKDEKVETNFLFLNK